MGTQTPAVLIQEGPRRVLPPHVPAEESGIIPVWDEADILALLLLRVAEALPCGNGPDLLLGQPPQGESAAGQLLLGQAVQHVALVLLRVEGLFQQTAASGAVPLHAHIVAGGHRLRPQLQGPAEQLPELDPPVAVHAGVGVQPAS